MKQRTVKTAPLSAQIRKLIEESGMSRYRLAQASGTDQATLSRFMTGKAGLGMKTLDQIGLHFGWEIVASKIPDKSKPKDG